MIRPPLISLSLNAREQENRDKIKTCKQERGTVAITVGKRGQQDKERKAICRGTIQEFHQTSWTLTLNVEKYGNDIDPDHPDIPSHAILEYSPLGDLTTQERAIYRLKSGEARLTALPLDLLLYGKNDELLECMAPVPETGVRPVHSFLQNNMNKEQKQAVELALAAPDFFLLQGPPGTGKTTFISELCYQLVLQEKKVLVSSQSNLAVDNALSRLAEHPKILAIRLGPEDKVQEIGADFVGDRAVLRWIRSLSRESRQQLEDLTKAKDLQSLLYSSKEWNNITQAFIQINTWNLQQDKIAHLQKEIHHHHQAKEKIAEVLPGLEEQSTLSMTMQETKCQITLLQQLLQDGSLEASTQEVHNVSQTYRDVLPRLTQAQALLTGELHFSDFPSESKYPTASLESKVSIWQTMELTLQRKEATMWLQEIAIDLTNLRQQISHGILSSSCQYNALNIALHQLKACIWVIDCNISSFSTYHSDLSKQILHEYQHALGKAQQRYQNHQHHAQELARKQNALQHHLDEAAQTAKRLQLWLPRLYSSLAIKPLYNGAGEDFENIYSELLPAVQSQLQRAIEESGQKVCSIQERIEGIRE